jgi:hypothetical protein
MLEKTIILAILSASTVGAAGVPVVESTAGPAEASVAFARYVAGLEQPSPWNSETVEIDASLSKFSKHGRLRAIRRLLPFGRPEYQVLEYAGDQTVKQQVIVRYLSGEVQAAAIPAAAVAVSPANYKFQYQGEVSMGERAAFVFLVTPHKKREGLIDGALWIDAETGTALRLSGHLVKKPSIFIKRVDVTRETAIRNGIAEMRVTHLAVDTRLVGLAHLTIQERPYSAQDLSNTLSVVEQ